MSRRDEYAKSVHELHDAAKRLSSTIGLSDGMGREVAAIAERLATVVITPSGMKTSDFQHSIGDELVLPAANERAPSQEVILNESDLLPVSFLEEGVRRQRAVARVVLTKPHKQFAPGTGWATGFLVSPSLFLTNNHVIEDQDFLKKIRLQFNFQNGADGTLQETQDFFPDLNFPIRTLPALDYTLIRLQPRVVSPTTGVSVLPGDVWGWIEMGIPPTFYNGQNLNIIQHPRGREKEIALQDNLISRLFENVIRYTTDTEPGSSGSPVFDNRWQLVALHHASGDLNPAGTSYVNNQGIRIDRIAADLRAHYLAADPTIVQELGI